MWPPRTGLFVLNKIGRGVLGDATYQIWRLYTLSVQTRRFRPCFLNISLSKTRILQNCEGNNVKKLSRGLLGYVTYQISRLCRGVNNKEIRQCCVDPTLCIVVSNKKILNFHFENLFSPCDLDMQRTKSILTFIDKGHIRTIPAKFGKNPARSLGEDVLWSNLLTKEIHPLCYLVFGSRELNMKIQRTKNDQW